jgi:hypothetical protein
MKEGTLPNRALLAMVPALMWGIPMVVQARLSDFPSAGYVAFFPGYALFYSIIALTSTWIIRKRLPRLKAVEIFKPVIKSTLSSTLIGLVLSFPAYSLIGTTCFGFFYTNQGVFRGNFNITYEVIFGLMWGLLWGLFLAMVSFAIAFNLEKKELSKAWEENHWNDRDVTLDQIRKSCRYSTLASHIFFAVAAIVVPFYHKDFSPTNRPLKEVFPSVTGRPSRLPVCHDPRIKKPSQSFSPTERTTTKVVGPASPISEDSIRGDGPVDSTMEGDITAGSEVAMGGLENRHVDDGRFNEEEPGNS